MDGAGQRPQSLDLPTAARVIARAGLFAKPITIGSRHEGAKGTVFIVGCDDGSAFVIKIYGHEYTERMLKEQRLYRLLEHSSLPLPRVIGWDEKDEDFNCAVMIMSVVDGVPLLDVLPRLSAEELMSVYRQIGVMQREIHKVTFDRFSLLLDIAASGHDDNVGLMRERCGAAIAELRKHGGSESLAVGLESYFRAHEVLFARCNQAVLCHNDFHEANILVDLAQGEVKITGLIDFENALAADPLFDLAKTHNHARRGSDQTLGALIGGYGELPPDWRKPFDLYVLFHALELRNWYAIVGAGWMLPAVERRMRRQIGVPSTRDRAASLFGR